VTRTRALGALPRARSARRPAVRHADLVYALYLGIGELRRAVREATLSGPKLESSIELAVQTVALSAAALSSLPAANRQATDELPWG